MPEERAMGVSYARGIYGLLSYRITDQSNPRKLAEGWIMGGDPETPLYKADFQIFP